MKIILHDGRRYVLRFDKGEEIIDGLVKFMKEQNISACTFNGIGSVGDIELGFYNSHIKEYRKKPIYEELEVLSLLGNGGQKEGQPVVHAHGIFGRTDFSVIGGHVFKMIAGVTAEIFLIKLDGNLNRQNNPDFNLNLLT